MNAGALLAAAAALALLLFLHRRRETRELRSFAASLASGDLEARLSDRVPAFDAFNGMAESLSERLRELGKERDALKAAETAMPDGLLVLDAQQRVVRANPAAERLLEVPEAAGKALWELLRHEGLLRAAGEVEKAGGVRLLRVTVGEERHLSVSLSRLGPGLLLLLHDATESVRYQELRKEFVANVSHELRTPLTVIRGYLETLEEGALADPVKGPEFLGIVGRHAAQLTNLVENLLDLSRLESPQGLIRRTAVDLGGLVARVAELHRASASRKQQTVETSVEGPLPAVPGDADYLERALANLVDNAVKYTPERGRIRVTARRAGEQVTVEVEDDGIGIPPGDLPRIWERFYRVDKSRSRSMGGTGLGLAIVKHVLQAHGGTVEVSSAPGKGSRFRISLPTALTQS